MQCTVCKPRSFPSTVNFKSSDFGCVLRNPQILPISVTMTNNGLDGYLFDVSIGNTGNTFTYKVVINNTTSLGNVINESCQKISSTSLSIQAIILDGNNLCAPNPNSYVLGDTYTIDLLSSCGINVSFFRPNNFTVEFPEIPCKNCQCLTGTVEVPQIFIEAQTSIDGSDISNAIFQICDKYTYYKEERLCLNGCKTETTSKVKETVFNRYCPKIFSVLKGKGKTTQDKAIYLAEKYNIDNSYDFYHNIILYSMTKYILSRILYGKFNISYLLRKYNEKFLSNLKHSRFCKFLEFFKVYDYNKYFKWDY